MTAATTPQERRRIGYRPELDGLRGVAILLVMLFHAGVMAPGAGQAGVTVFFVLSGFLITSLLLAEQRDNGIVSYLGFLRRRALRLLPALLVVSVAVAGWYLVTGRGGLITGDVGPALLYATNWMIVAGEDQGLLGHAWTLSIEEHFYIVWPFVLLGVVRWPRIGVAMVITYILGVMGIRLIAHGPESHAFLMLSTPTRIEAPLAGCLLALAAFHGRLRAHPHAAIAGAVLVAFAAAIVHVWAIVMVGITLATVGAMLMLAALEDRSSRILSFGPLVWIGKVSYALYLWHQPIMQELRPVLSGPLEVPVTVGISLAVAALTYRFVETPFLRRRRSMPDSADRSPTAPKALQPLTTARQGASGGPS